jgi:hypothetical protein
MTAALQDVADAARAYRAAEAEETPRLWRGKRLHDLGIALDRALEHLDAPPETLSDG